MDEDAIKALIKEYIVENLDIEIEAHSYTYNGPTVVVTLYLDGEVLASSSDTLPSPKVSY